jgi:hypothetical protein
MREVIFAAVLLVACGLVVAGVAVLSTSGAFIVAGVVLAGWSWLVLSEPTSRPAPDEATS